MFLWFAGRPLHSAFAHSVGRNERVGKRSLKPTNVTVISREKAPDEG